MGLLSLLSSTGKQSWVWGPAFLEPPQGAIYGEIAMSCCEEHDILKALASGQLLGDPDLAAFPQGLGRVLKSPVLGLKLAAEEKHGILGLVRTFAPAAIKGTSSRRNAEW